MNTVLLAAGTLYLVNREKEEDESIRTIEDGVHPSPQAPHQCRWHRAVPLPLQARPQGQPRQLQPPLPRQLQEEGPAQREDHLRGQLHLPVVAHRHFRRRPPPPLGGAAAGRLPAH